MKNSLIIITTCFLIISGPASAKQKSIDKDLFEAFEVINKRSDDHEARVNRLAIDRKVILKDLMQKNKDLTQLADDDGTPETRQRRHTLQAELNKLATQHLKVSYQMVFSAEQVISANLGDIAKLTERLKNSPTSRAQILKLKREIERNTKVGRMMKQNLLRMKSWSNADPMMKAKFKDLKRIMRNLDQRISISKSMFPKSGSDEKNGFSSRRIAALNKSTKVLLDKLAGVQTEKERLSILKGRLEHNVDLFRLRRTLDIARRATPQLTFNGSGSFKTESKQDNVQNIIEDLNNDIAKNNNLDEEEEENQEVAQDKTFTGSIKTNEFRNF